MCYYRTDDGKCRKFSDDKYTAYCVDGPCPYDTPTYARELSELARESVKRDMALAMMEVEVEAALREIQARESGCVYCINCPEKIIANKERYSHATETGVAYDNIKVNFCPNCGKRLKVGHEAG